MYRHHAIVKPAKTKATRKCGMVVFIQQSDIGAA